ncbi:unnamed protein product, partial [Phaeothamnion confervicola]
RFPAAAAALLAAPDLTAWCSAAQGLLSPPPSLPPPPPQRAVGSAVKTPGFSERKRGRDESGTLEDGRRSHSPRLGGTPKHASPGTGRQAGEGLGGTSAERNSAVGSTASSGVALGRCDGGNGGGAGRRLAALRHSTVGDSWRTDRWPADFAVSAVALMALDSAMDTASDAVAALECGSTAPRDLLPAGADARGGREVAARCDWSGQLSAVVGMMRALLPFVKPPGVQPSAETASHATRLQIVRGAASAAAMAAAVLGDAAAAETTAGVAATGPPGAPGAAELAAPMRLEAAEEDALPEVLGRLVDAFASALESMQRLAAAEENAAATANAASTPSAAAVADLRLWAWTWGVVVDGCLSVAIWAGPQLADGAANAAVTGGPDWLRRLGTAVAGCAREAQLLLLAADSPLLAGDTSAASAAATAATVATSGVGDSVDPLQPWALPEEALPSLPFARKVFLLAALVFAAASPASAEEESSEQESIDLMEDLGTPNLEAHAP